MSRDVAAQLWCCAISAKRYCLNTVDERGEPVLIDAKEHELGHLLNLTDPDLDDRAWIRQLCVGSSGRNSV